MPSPHTQVSSLLLLLLQPQSVEPRKFNGHFIAHYFYAKVCDDMVSPRSGPKLCVETNYITHTSRGEIGAYIREWLLQGHYQLTWSLTIFCPRQECKWSLEFFFNSIYRSHSSKARTTQSDYILLAIDHYMIRYLKYLPRSRSYECNEWSIGMASTTALTTTDTASSVTGWPIVTIFAVLCLQWKCLHSTPFRGCELGLCFYNITLLGHSHVKFDHHNNWLP